MDVRKGKSYDFGRQAFDFTRCKLFPGDSLIISWMDIFRSNDSPPSATIQWYITSTMGESAVNQAALVILMPRQRSIYNAVNSYRRESIPNRDAVKELWSGAINLLFHILRDLRIALVKNETYHGPNHYGSRCKGI